MRILDLTGVWHLSSPGVDLADDLDVVVPGGVHPALMEAGLIPDPGIGDNAAEVKWVGERDWVFERPFEVDEALLAHDIVDLEFDGIDTVAEVFVNGVSVLKTDNMFHRWHAEVKHVLKPGANEVRVVVSAPCHAVAAAGRKARFGFGSAYSPECVTAGISRPVRLRAWNVAHFCDFGFSQRHEDGAVLVFLGGWIETVGDSLAGLGVRFEITDPDGACVCRGVGDVAEQGDGAFNARARIDAPRLWWPNGLGDQPLYGLEVALCGADGATLDRITCRIGLRTLVAEADDAGRPRRLACNGVPFALKGAVWIPPGLFPSRVAIEDYAYLVGSAAEAGLNALRMWEGGTFESEAFWDVCDELGIVVLGLAKIGSAAGDDDDGGGEDHRYRLLPHACIPDVLLGEPDESDGLCVLRDVLSYPAPETLEACVPPASRNITCAAMEARVAGGRGAGDLVAALAAAWPLPGDFRDWLWLSQIAHGVAVCGVIAGKLRDPACPGVLWEPFASCWAIADGSSIDADGRWKALHYLVQDEFDPVTVHGFVRDGGRVEASILNTGADDVAATFAWRAMTLDGHVLDLGERELTCPAGATVEDGPIDLHALLDYYGHEDVVVWLSLMDGEGYVLSRAPVIFAPPKHLAMVDPHLAVDVADTLDVDGEQAFKVTVSAASPAFWVWLDLPGEQAQFSDNFFCLEPDEPHDVYVSTVNRMTQFAFRRKLVVRSLYDIRCSPMRGG
ncbi:MAG: glycosyl hydrolase 2 galactose-binding domain-containing protein [Kiritimatiellia bacterium]|jgi:beta-galactosidase/beta-glucuronidase